MCSWLWGRSDRNGASGMQEGFVCWGSGVCFLGEVISKSIGGVGRGRCFLVTKLCDVMELWKSAQLSAEQTFVR